jgi:DNA-binding transcriptional LysR family regulator
MVFHAKMLSIDMNLRSLETALWIIRLGSFSAAARHLRLSQPAITRRINELELELGVSLFNRERPQVSLTPAGKRCIQIAERIVADISNLKATASDGLGISGVVRIGVAEVIALSWLDSLLARMKENYPNIDVDLDIDISGRLTHKLASRNIDIALVPGTVSLAGAVTQSLGEYGLSWMARPGFLPDDREITPQDLLDVPIIMSPKDANVHTVMQKWFLQTGVKPRRLSYSTSFSVVTALTRNGLGMSLLPHDFFREDIDNGTLTIIAASPKIAPMEYHVTFIPTPEMSFLPEIARLAREESRFFKAGGP